MKFLHWRWRIQCTTRTGCLRWTAAFCITRGHHCYSPTFTGQTNNQLLYRKFQREHKCKKSEQHPIYAHATSLHTVIRLGMCVIPFYTKFPEPHFVHVLLTTVSTCRTLCIVLLIEWNQYDLLSQWQSAYNFAPGYFSSFYLICQ